MGDVARLAAAAAAVVCAVIGQWDDVARFVVVLGVLVLSRTAKLPRPFDAAMGVTLVIATVAMPAGWYETVAWADLPIHGTATGAIAAVVVMALIRVDYLPPLQGSLLRRRRAAIVMLVVMVGFTVGVLWEFWEWVATHVAGIVMVVGYTDTVADLAMDGAGALLAGLGVAAWASQGHSSQQPPSRP
ncbi:hypothetical protein [Paractinoplanes rishiriensis]|uniref:DUF2238 domain-containing protein n=1 Tax=Paractinoplanes rishiriensis TaxID=1050105 RepID=A0A919MZQ9_9ACTN|nr:hypothetical protein [Actinoplanes rishiriensis]GIF01844.1 hypothetical protein Ari01nite_93080 [Actinoplanes rishiriensis]